MNCCETKSSPFISTIANQLSYGVGPNVIENGCFSGKTVAPEVRSEIVQFLHSGWKDANGNSRVDTAELLGLSPQAKNLILNASAESRYLDVQNAVDGVKGIGGLALAVGTLGLGAWGVYALVEAVGVSWWTVGAAGAAFLAGASRPRYEYAD